MLLIWGDADAALSVRNLRGTERYVSDLTLRILPGVSHWVQQEAAESVNSILREWLPAYHGE
jgi:pimeloyl-ACP methyl ester carboxylesterase